MKRIAIFYFLSSILMLTSGASAAPATTTTTTASEPWRPAADRKPGFGILISPGVVPCVLHVNGLRFPLATGTPLTAKYDWDFGDPQGQFNHLSGFNAAHFYLYPGDYTVTLTVTDEAGTVASATAHISLTADRRRAIYVSPGGSDLNVGTSPEAPLHSLGKAFKILPDNCLILMKAGNTYLADNVLKIDKTDVLIGRYGEGADPVVMLSKQDGPKPPHGFISIDNRCNGVTIEHLTFDSPYAAPETGEAPKIGLDAIAARGRNITIRDCTFLNVDCAVNANGSPTGLLVQGCKAPMKTGIRAYFVWAQGTDFVCIGNSAANSTREHIVRMSGVQRAMIFDNNFTNLDRRPADKYDTSKGTIEMHNGAYAYISGNTVAGGTIRVGPLGLHEDPSTATDWSVIENNDLTGTFIVAYPGSHHVMIRNNVLHNDNIQAIQLQAPDGDGRINSDLQILNNTAIDNGSAGAFLKLWGHVDGIDLKNNLLVAPSLKVGTNGAAAVNLVESDLSSFRAIEGNVWPALGNGEAENEFVMNKQTITAAAWKALAGVKADRYANVALDQTGLPAAEFGGAKRKPVATSGPATTRSGVLEHK